MSDFEFKRLCCSCHDAWVVSDTLPVYCDKCFNPWISEEGFSTDTPYGGIDYQAGGYSKWVEFDSVIPSTTTRDLLKQRLNQHHLDRPSLVTRCILWVTRFLGVCRSGV